MATDPPAKPARSFKARLLGHEPMTAFDAILPLTVAIVVEVLMVSDKAPFLEEVIKANVGYSGTGGDSQLNPQAAVPISLVFAVGIPLLATAILAVVGKLVSALTLRGEGRLRFGLILASASWAYLPLVAKHMAQLAILSRHQEWSRILTGRAASLNSFADLAPMTGLGYLMTGSISPLGTGGLVAGSIPPLLHVIDLVNPFEALHIAVFTWLIERGTKVKRARALTITIVSWLAWSAMRVAPYFLD